MYQIDRNDPDLRTFELYVAQQHPEFSVLIQEGRPSYEHPEFCSKTINFKYLPGSIEPYCPLALSLFDKEDVDRYILHCINILNRSIQVGDKTFKQLVSECHENIDKRPVPVSADELQTNPLKRVELGIFRALEPAMDSAMLDGVHGVDLEALHRTVLRVNKVVDVVGAFALSGSGESKLIQDYNEAAQYAFWAIYFLRNIEVKLDLYIQVYASQLAAERRVDIEAKVPMYPLLIIANEMLKKAEEIRVSMNKPERKAEVRTPSDFIYQYKSGQKAKDFRADFRWLYIKAWLYSYIQHNPSKYSARALAEVIAGDQRFFYLCNQQDPMAKRLRSLQTTLSAWRNHKGIFHGYISENIYKKLERNYYVNNPQVKREGNEDPDATSLESMLLSVFKW